MKSLPLLLVTVVAAVSGAQGAPAPSHASAIVVTPATVKFGPAPASLPPGADLAVIEGDPSKPGEFTMRLSMPDGYTIPPHFHPANEHVTVLQGTFLVGMGDVLDASKLSPLPVGSFGMIPPGMRHFARARGRTIIQLHGEGPWSLTYVKASDDPRNKGS